METPRTTSAALSDRAAEMLERMVSQEQARERERILDRPRRLWLELDRRHREIVGRQPKSCEPVQLTPEGDHVLTEHCTAAHVFYTTATTLGAEAKVALDFLREAEELARRAHCLPRQELIERCAELAQRADVDLD